MTRNEALVANNEALAAELKRYRDAQLKLFVESSVDRSDRSAVRQLCELDIGTLRDHLRVMEEAAAQVFELEQERKRIAAR